MVLNEDAQKRKRVTLENLHERVAEGKIRELKIVLKADVQGLFRPCAIHSNGCPPTKLGSMFIHSGVGGSTKRM